MKCQITTYLSLETALVIHETALEKFGGASGVRDQDLLEAAVMQPQQTFDGKDLYPTLEEKAARYAFGIVSNHPFVDGNKRTGAALMLTFLAMNQHRMKPRQGEIANIILDVATGVASFDDLVAFLRAQP